MYWFPKSSVKLIAYCLCVVYNTGEIIGYEKKKNTLTYDTAFGLRK